MPLGRGGPSEAALSSVGVPTTRQHGVGGGRAHRVLAAALGPAALAPWGARPRGWARPPDGQERHPAGLEHGRGVSEYSVLREGARERGGGGAYGDQGHQLPPSAAKALRSGRWKDPAEAEGNPRAGGAGGQEAGRGAPPSSSHYPGGAEGQPAVSRGGAGAGPRRAAWGCRPGGTAPPRRGPGEGRLSWGPEAHHAALVLRARSLPLLTVAQRSAPPPVSARPGSSAPPAGSLPGSWPHSASAAVGHPSRPLTLPGRSPLPGLQAPGAGDCFRPGPQNLAQGRKAHRTQSCLPFAGPRGHRQHPGPSPPRARGRATPSRPLGAGTRPGGRGAPWVQPEPTGGAMERGACPRHTGLRGGGQCRHPTAAPPPHGLPGVAVAVVPEVGRGQSLSRR
ncbi:PREDICTED: collagen alpha-1(I) chain [Condylura cristata]|uniref:collagen alpha-1(I) chain n=1 Tax=Condylura cristata TaxID=143302 RepID=UPI0006436C32|nr:PREDICTED: collagen alpha-1(I) chain [Condylura cristata]